MHKTLAFLIFLTLLSVTGNAIAQQLDWARSIGASGTLSPVNAVKTDPSGNVIAVGFFNGPVDFDPGTGVTILTPVTSEDLFIQKLDADGNLLWVKSMNADLQQSSDFFRL